MAKIGDRLARNVPGQFYVDAQCIYCALCVEMAPSVFRESEPAGWAFVYAQPSSEAEIRAAQQAAEGCPTESIGFDGDQYDWSGIPSVVIPEWGGVEIQPRGFWRRMWRIISGRDR